MARFRVLEQCRVSPPSPAAGAAFLPFTFFDVIWLHGEPVERVFFYRWPHPHADFLAEILPRLKSSLTHALSLFYPLAGRIATDNDDDDGRRRYGILYTAGDSVQLTVVESEADNFDELAGDEPRACSELRPLLPTLPAAAAVLALQVTVFPNRGFSLAVVVHHSACDGSSSIRFLKSWATACRNGGGGEESTGSADLAVVNVPSPPIYDRTLIPDPVGLYWIYLDDVQCSGAHREEKKQLTIAAASSDVVESTTTLIATLPLGRELIEKLRKHVTAKQQASGGDPFRCSTFVLGLSYAWSCLIKSTPAIDEDGADNYDKNKKAHAVFSVDCRSRLNPPVPEGYFGNCLSGCFAEAKFLNLVGENGVYTAAEAVGTAIEKMLRRGVMEGAETLTKTYLGVVKDGGRMMSVAGSPRLGVYEVDFGWGRPEKVVVPSIEVTGAISMAENRDAGGGGLEIGIALPAAAMDAFRSSFADGFHFL